MCTLAAFREIVENVRPKNWKEECQVPGTCSPPHFTSRLGWGANVVEKEKEPTYQLGSHQ
jgi:hypothetical protein